MNTGRRQFLKASLAGAGVMGAGVLAYYIPSFLKKDALAVNIPANIPANTPAQLPEALTFPQEWNFFEPWQPNTVKDDLPLFINTRAALNSSLQLPDDSPELPAILPTLKENLTRELAKLNMPLGQTATVTRQAYGTPLQKEKAEAYKNYALKAYSYLNETLRGVKQLTPNWTVIKKSDDYSANFNGNAYFSQGHELLYAITQQHGSKTFTAHTVLPIASSGIYFKMDRTTGTIENFYIILAPGASAISAPFTSVLPLTTVRRAYDYGKQHGLDETLLAGETIVEGISYHLAKKLSQELNIPHREKLLEQSLQELQKPQYNLVPASVNWIARHGAQEALDLFMDSPDRYIEAIKKA